MGVEGIAIRTSSLSASEQATETIQNQKSDCVSISKPDVTIDTRKCPQLERTSQSEQNLMDACRRRTSLPSTVLLGAITASSHECLEERRWRSFDSSTTSMKTKSVDVLSTRIQHEEKEMKRLRPHKRRSLLRSIQTLVSSDHGESSRLRQMQLMTEKATRNRTLTILNDMRTLMMTFDEVETSYHQTQMDQKRSTPRNSFICTIDKTIEQLLDGMTSTDQVLDEDCLHHMLSIQTKWLTQTIQMHENKNYDVPRPSTNPLSLSMVLQQFLSEFIHEETMCRIPCAMDEPTSALIRFEKLLTRYKILPTTLKQSFDTLCLETMSSFIHSNNTTANIWTERSPKQVMRSLIQEMMEAIIEIAWVKDSLRGVLQAFLEQMVYSRLGAICYRDHAVELDEQNVLWREQVVHARDLGLEQVGLPLPLLNQQEGELFARSIQAFNRIPHLIPSCVLAAFLNAIRVLYEEARGVFGLEGSSCCISADMLLPLLVYVLSRCHVPHLPSQVFAMEQFAIDTTQEGSEAAYYVACLQAAMGYIMMEMNRQSDVKEEELSSS